MSYESICVACDKRGAHSGSFVKHLCLDPRCLEGDFILCDICKVSSHSQHDTMNIRDFFSQLKHRVSSKRLADFHSINEMISESARIIESSLANFKILVDR